MRIFPIVISAAFWTCFSLATDEGNVDKPEEACLLSEVFTFKSAFPECAKVPGSLHDDMIFGQDSELKSRIFDLLGAYETNSDKSYQSNYDTVWNSCVGKTLTCDPSYPYRSYDGSCNNLDNPTWAMAGSVMPRLAPPEYSDGISKLRTSYGDGSPLPRPRLISNNIFTDQPIRDKVDTVAMVGIGQFLTHDCMFAPAQQYGGKDIKCCPPSQFARDLDKCIPIMIDPTDFTFSLNNRSCIEMVRSQRILTGYCDPQQPAQQLSGVSQILDLSQVYGNSIEANRAVRMQIAGLLKFKMVDMVEYPPQDTSKNAGCPMLTSRSACYKTGDVRANQNPHLAALHVLFLREHNRIARIVLKLKPHWTDEQIFQLARHINIAKYQHIVYNEYLMALLGPDISRKFLLSSSQTGYSVYRPYVNPSTINEYSAGVGRGSHSTIAPTVSMCSLERATCKKPALLSEFWNDPTVLEERAGMDSVLSGMTIQPKYQSDRYHTEQITKFLFKGKNDLVGIDLETLDIYRGRDHGMPNYNRMRKVCGLTPFYSFADLKTAMSAENAGILAKTYKSIDDIDLYVGGVLENPAAGASVGPLFTCLHIEQFYRWKFGDRWWYEHGEQVGSFSPDALNEVRKSTLAEIICQNSANNIVNKYSFLQLTDNNKPVLCSSVNKVDIAKIVSYY